MNDFNITVFYSYRKELSDDKENKEYRFVSLDESLFENLMLFYTLGMKRNNFTGILKIELDLELTQRFIVDI